MKKDATIRTLMDTPIEDDHCTTIRLGPNQAPKALTQLDHSLGQGIGPKRVKTFGLGFFVASLVHRMTGHAKWQTWNDHHSQTLTPHTHSFPKRIRPHQDGILVLDKTA